MAIDFTDPAALKHIVYESLHISSRRNRILWVFEDPAGEEIQFVSKPEEWSALLTFLFKDLANAAELKTRSQSWIVTNRNNGGTIVPD